MNNDALKRDKMIYWNKNIKKEDLEKFGFKDRVNGERFYFMRYLEKDISLNITYKVKDDILKIDVLDENFLQPYDYQYILKENPSHTFARAVKDSVDSELYKMQDCGIIHGFDSANYVYYKYSQGKCWN